MGLKKILILFSVVCWTTNRGLGQTAQQRQAIVKDYPLERIRILSDHYAQVYKKRKKEAISYARLHNRPVVIRYDNGEKSYLQRIDDHNNLIYIKAYDRAAAHTIGADNLYPGGEFGLELKGQGMTAGLWDDGKVRGSHELLARKITQKDTAKEDTDHATHVAGIIVGKELSARRGRGARGIAYQADLDAYDWNSDLSEMFDAARNGLLVSNHSYGIDLTQIRKRRLKDILGIYDKRSEAVDKLSFQAPHYTVICAAGNDRENNPNPNDRGYNLLAGDMSTAKNDIVVTAVYRVSDYTGPESVRMTKFSSWGPTNDNRVKPDISADGDMVLSSVATDESGAPSDDSYAWYTGTSAAAPSVTGGILLLQELSSHLNDGTFLRSATIKALITATARQAGTGPGPDPRFGWGLLDIAGAAKLMLDDSAGETAFYNELTLVNNDAYSKTVEADGKDGFTVTIAWTDPPGKVQRSGEANAVLVNDLDLRVTDSKGQVYYPWRLSKNDYAAPAQNDGDNKVDNVEQIFVPSSRLGEEYTITVIHKGELSNGKQDFSIAAVGISPRNRRKHSGSPWLTIYPNPASQYVNLSLKKAKGRVQVSVFNMSGKYILHQNFAGNSLSVDKVLDISSLSSGLYFIQVQTENQKGVKKLIVK